ncbi:ricin-type beta-trefoil lectin domain protein [Streptomyces sp. FIT100]|uniref:ricin-type beta-trefoil lectin domain protein n=1 Tax=Streptomyces sp. FIT100 TaxID=2837956 RepID=UPI0021C657F7|nr:ricin-type beta-trefoil lectin domain protein [Streptomyces sp. FIT100]
MITGVAVALTVSLMPGAYAVPPPDGTRLGVDLVDLPEADVAPGENGGSLAEMTTHEVPPVVDYEPTKTAAPVGAAAVETVTGLTAGETVPVGTLPVGVGAPGTATPEETAALEGDWQVALADQSELADTEIEGLVFTVTPPATATGKAVVAVDYTEFAELYGANWADRLQLVQYPQCFLTTPDVEGCDEPTEVDTQNVVEAKSGDDPGDGVLDGERRIEATVDVASLTDPGAGGASPAAAKGGMGTVDDALYRPSGARASATAVAATALTAAAAESGSSVFVAQSSGGGSKGDFSATPLVSAGSWTAGSSSGGFSYSYAMQVPQVPGGPAPSVGFGYNSQVVDGRTSASNNQPSWIGDGWEYNAGSITRTYKSCRDDREGSANNENRKTGDLCWGSYNATMTLGGTTTELVLPDGAEAESDQWVTANGDGSRVELVKDTGLGNGDADGEYWRVTTRDGMQYHFGRHKLPGWSDNGAAADDPVTDSVLSVPVAGNHSGEPCRATAFADSFCKQAWRWNLDYVVDPQGNAMSLWWEKETNHFAQNLKFKSPVKYDRGGYLTQIDYGQRESTLFSAPPVARVSFAVDERCYAEDGIACTDANFASGDFAKNRIWYDTPADLYCSGASGKECYVPVPTFWSRKRLASVTTLAQRTEGSTALSKVDSWTLQQALPADRTDEGVALWLESISRTGFDPAGEVIALRPVQFVANTASMPNRVKEGSGDPNPVFDRLRIERVVNEYGGETLVDYAAPVGACATGSGFPKPEENTGRCFPAYWHPDPDKADESIDWFHKYVVDNVQELAGITGIPPTTTSYEYVGGGAWGLNQAEFSKKKTRTYDQWRGYELVRTISGADRTDTYEGTQRSMSETRYFRGMDGDPLPGGGKRSVELKDSTGATIAVDKLAYQGRVGETLTYNRNGGDLLTRSVDYPTHQVLATRTRHGGIPALQAFRVLADHSISVTRASGTLPGDTRTWRTIRTSTEHEDTYGLPVKVESQGDTDKTGDETCSVMSYVHNTAKHLIGLSKETLTTAGTCADAASATGADWISGSRVAYDAGAFGAVPSVGLATTTWDVSGSGGGWTQAGTVEYDSYGRPTRTTNAEGKADTTAYDPPTGQVHAITTMNALLHSSTTEIEPGRGTTLKETDANGRTTVYAYDALGRATKGWNINQPASEPPSVEFEYNTTAGEPVSVVTRALREDGGYDTSTVFYDGLGRERQRQDPAVGEGRLITDIKYSANGTIERTNNAYYATGDPQKVMYEVESDFNVPNATLYKYDGAGRLLQETPYEAGTERPEKASKYEYGFDYSVAVEPTGAATQRSWTDALGRIVQVDTFTDPTRTVARTTKYGYDARGDKVRATEHKTTAAAASATWTWEYDARGRLVSATDPDAGTSSTTYDTLNRPVTTTKTVNGQPLTVWSGYDALSRPTAQRLGSSSGTKLTEFTYDSLSGGKGLPVSATRYTDNLAYTTSVTGYTADYKPTGKTLTLPSTTAVLWGLEPSYTYSYDYTKMGQPRSVTLPKAGALAAEKVITRYNQDGLPVSTSGLDWYTAETTYSAYGEVLRTATGEHPNRVWTTNLFDERTGELTESIVDRESITDTTVVPDRRVNSRKYAYDPAGNVTSIADTSNSVTDRQCFTYDHLGQLTEAWTAPGASCKAAGKATAEPAYADGTKNVTASSNGYWQSYSYDEVGNRKELVKHDPAFDVAKDATTTYTYGENGKPHTLTSLSSTYTSDAGAEIIEDAAFEYDESGNTTSRTFGGDEQALTWTWDGKVEKVTGFGENGTGPWNGLAGKCLDLGGASTTPGTAIQLYSCNSSKAQNFRIDAASSTDPTTGSLKILGMCAMPKDGGTANGTLIVIAACTGAENQKWQTIEAGHKLKHIASGKCLDVPAANSADGTDLQLYTCDTNGTAQSWTPAKETTYIYGPGGERLLALNGSERTLYLGDTTVSMTVNATHSYTERYYAQPGAPTVMRHVLGNSAPNLSAQITDQNGTAYLNVTLAAGNKPQFSKTDPFGVKRSETNSWRSHRGYIGGDQDTGSGLVHLGAREYDPALGRFISADPVLDLNDPVQKSGYVYCENNPVTYADPTGMASENPGMEFGGPSNGEIAAANATLNTSISSVILSIGWAALKEFVGWNDVVGCFSRGDLWACGSLFANAIPWTKLFKVAGVIAAAYRIAKAIGALMKAKEQARKVLALARKAAELARKAAEAKKKAAARAAQLKKRAEQAATRAAKAAAKKTGNQAQKQAKNQARQASKPIAKKEAASKPPAKKAAEPEPDSKPSGTCPSSFVPGTLVLMADGTTKPIKDVKNGDKVLATDPETGETSVETVTAERKSKGFKHFVKVTIDTDGAKGTKTASVTATDKHPFWVPEVGKWLDATDLRTGQWLQTGTGTYAQITALQRWTSKTATTVHNLTVSDLHTYYVLTGTTPVLIHNCDDFIGPKDHVALGREMKDGTASVEDFADAIQARHFMNSTDWQGDVQGAINRLGRGEGNISFLLDGLPGGTQGPAKALKLAREAMKSKGGAMATQWELVEIDKAGLMGQVDFYRWNRRLGAYGKVK